MRSSLLSDLLLNDSLNENRKGREDLLLRTAKKTAIFKR